MKWDSVIANGMLLLNENDNKEANDFQFVKVRQKKISILELGPGTECSFAVVKKMTGQGVLYIRIKPGFEFLHEEDKDSSLEEAEETSDHTVSNSPVQPVVNAFRSGDGDDKPIQEGSGEPSNPVQAVDLPEKEPDELLAEIDKHSLSDPVEILRCLQQQVIKGIALDVVDSNNTPEGETNYITVDRSNILTTTFAEFESIDDFCKTFEVDFMGEEARDLGGPRKE